MTYSIYDPDIIHALNYYKSIEEQVPNFLYETKEIDIDLEYVKANCVFQKYIIALEILKNHMAGMTKEMSYRTIREVDYVDKVNVEIYSQSVAFCFIDGTCLALDFNNDIAYEYGPVNGESPIDALAKACCDMDIKPVYMHEAGMNYRGKVDNSREFFTGLYGFELYNKFEKYLTKKGFDTLYKINDELFIKANALNIILYKINKTTDDNGNVTSPTIDEILNGSAEADYEYNAAPIAYYQDYTTFMKYLRSIYHHIDKDIAVSFEDLESAGIDTSDNFLKKIEDFNLTQNVELLASSGDIYTSEYTESYRYYSVKKNAKDIGYCRTVEQVSETVLTNLLLSLMQKGLPFSQIIMVLKNI